jgi:hypothetical protein
MSLHHDAHSRSKKGVSKQGSLWTAYLIVKSPITIGIGSHPAYSQSTAAGLILSPLVDRCRAVVGPLRSDCLAVIYIITPIVSVYDDPSRLHKTAPYLHGSPSALNVGCKSSQRAPLPPSPSSHPNSMCILSYFKSHCVIGPRTRA